VDARRTQRWLVASFVALCFLCPLPFACVTQPFRLLAATILALLFFGAVATNASWSKHTTAKVVPLLLLAGFAFLQSVALPRAVVNRLSPLRLELAEAASRALGQAPPVSLPLSLAPELSRLAGTEVLAFVVACLLAALAARDRWGERFLQASLVGAGLCQVLVGALWKERNERWGITLADAEGRLRGTFVNPDHAACFLALVAPLALAWAFASWERFRREPNREPALLGLAGGMLAFLVLALGVVFSASRAGLLALALATATTSAFLARARAGWMAAAGFGALLVALLLAGLSAWQAAFGRWLATVPGALAWDTRVQVWQHTWHMARKFLWAGSGFGTFRYAFAIAPGQEVPASVSFWHAHNDYLELLLTTGIPGVLLVAFAAFRVVRALYRTWSSQLSGTGRALPAAAFGTLAAACLHACFDFALSLPAVWLALGAVLGLALGHAVDSGQERRAP
jgi:O-antigen ligase